LVIAAGIFFYYFFDSISVEIWDGMKDLDIRFVVTDASTGDAVPYAKVEVWEELPRLNSSRLLHAVRITSAPLQPGGSMLVAAILSREQAWEWFEVFTDARGVTAVRCFDCWTSGRNSAFHHTWGISLPAWRFRVSAPSYCLTGLHDLRTEYHHQAVRGDKVASLTVRIGLDR
jgi:hypothetical protein